MGMENLVWSGLIRSVHLVRDERLEFREVSIALTPIMQILLVLSAALAFRSRFWLANDVGRISRAFVIAGVSVCVLFFLPTIKVHNFSLFYFLYPMVPGANAIRVGYRGMVVANLVAVTAIALTIDRAFLFLLQKPQALLRHGRLGVLTALLSLAAIEQVNLGQRTHLSREFERKHTAAVIRAPRECRSFYAAPQPGRPPFEVQIHAMMIALTEYVPTINGWSGLFPPGWNFYDTNVGDYEQRATRWAVKRGFVETFAGSMSRAEPGRWLPRVAT